MARLIQLEGDGAQVDVLLAEPGEDISPVGVRDLVRETVRVAADEVFASVTGLASFLLRSPACRSNRRSWRSTSSSRAGATSTS